MASWTHGHDGPLLFLSAHAHSIWLAACHHEAVVSCHVRRQSLFLLHCTRHVTPGSRPGPGRNDWERVSAWKAVGLPGSGLKTVARREQGPLAPKRQPEGGRGALRWWPHPVKICRGCKHQQRGNRVWLIRLIWPVEVHLDD